MRITFSQICFIGKPFNYAEIDKYVSRSAQIGKDDLLWLKDQGVTDVFNFRTMDVPMIDFDEAKEVEKLGMNYHHIPTFTDNPSEIKVKMFLSEVDEVIKNNGKAHIHCKAGSDRTGMYSYIYKMVKGIGTRYTNQAEMINMGHDFKLFPNLIPWAENFLKKLKL